jgi:hypothetical protein
MSSPSRSSTHSGLLLKVDRKRASTKGLLGSEYQAIVTKVLNPPKPGKNAQDYDGEPLREGFKYADSNLRTTECNLPPLGMRAVLLYKDAVVNLLDLEENMEPEQDEEEVEAAKEAWLTIVRMHEESAQYKACLAITNSSDAQTLQDEIVSYSGLHSSQGMAMHLQTHAKDYAPKAKHRKSLAGIL